MNGINVQRAIDGPNYIPKQMFEAEKYDPYFSPGGYIMSGEVALNMAMMVRPKSYVPDGIYIGTLLEKLGFNITAGDFPGVCLGSVNGNGKYLTELDPKFLTNPCFISGLYVIDGLPDKEMDHVYKSLRVSIDYIYARTGPEIFLILAGPSASGFRS